MMIPLTKTLEPSDLEALAPELEIVDRHFDSEQRQSHMRRWEYAMALKALKAHRHNDLWSPTRTPHLIDVGGAGSPFANMLLDYFGQEARVTVVDPAAPPYVTLEQYHRSLPHLCEAVFSLSVLEHVEDLDEFLYHLSCLVAPGGLLFLTMDCWDRWGQDTAHFNWMRRRIFNWDDFQPDPPYDKERYRPDSIAWVRDSLRTHQFDLFGVADWTYHDHQVYGSYSFGSLAMVKRA